MAPSLSLYGWKANLPPAERIEALNRAAADLGWLCISRKFQMMSNSKGTLQRLAAIEDHKYATNAYQAEKDSELLKKKLEKAGSKQAKKSSPAAVRAKAAPSAKSVKAAKQPSAVKRAGPKAKKTSAAAAK
jgi:hypothetical protein